MKKVELSEMVLKEENLKLFTTFPATEDVNLAINKMKDRFDFHRGQIVNIGLSVEDGSENKFKVPIVVTKVHPADVNGHNTYDYDILVRGRCEFISSISDKERYLWRWVLKGSESIPEQWFIDLLPTLLKYEQTIKPIDDEITREDIFFINEDDVAVYPYINN